MVGPSRCMGHVTHMDESCETYGYGTSHKRWSSLSWDPPYYTADTCTYTYIFIYITTATKDTPNTHSFHPLMENTNISKCVTNATPQRTRTNSTHTQTHTHIRAQHM